MDFDIISYKNLWDLSTLRNGELKSLNGLTSVQW